MQRHVEAGSYTRYYYHKSPLSTTNRVVVFDLVLSARHKKSQLTDTEAALDCSMQGLRRSEFSFLHARLFFHGLMRACSGWYIKTINYGYTKQTKSSLQPTGLRANRPGCGAAARGQPPDRGLDMEGPGQFHFTSLHTAWAGLLGPL